MPEMRNLTGGVAGLLALVLCVSPALARAQSTPPPPPPTQNGTRPPPEPPKPPEPPDQQITARTGAELPPQNLDRIRKGLSQEPRLKLDENQLRFYVQVLAKLPRIEDLIGDYDLMNGPTRGGNPMTHNEFLGLVTPREMYGSAGIKPAEMLQFALVNWLGQAFVKRIVNDLRNARSEREIQEIRDRIDRELAALRGRRGGG